MALFARNTELDIYRGLAPHLQADKVTLNSWLAARREYASTGLQVLLSRIALERMDASPKP